MSLLTPQLKWYYLALIYYFCNNQWSYSKFSLSPPFSLFHCILSALLETCNVYIVFFNLWCHSPSSYIYSQLYEIFTFNPSAKFSLLYFGLDEMHLWNQILVNIFYKLGTGSKYFRLCKLYGLCHEFTTLPLCHKTNHRQYIDK